MFIVENVSMSRIAVIRMAPMSSNGIAAARPTSPGDCRDNGSKARGAQKGLFVVLLDHEEGEFLPGLLSAGRIDNSKRRFSAF
jgi:hypothetical protein